MPSNRAEDRRVFTFDLSDRVKGVWDETVPLQAHISLEGVGIDVAKDYQSLTELSLKFLSGLNLDNVTASPFLSSADIVKSLLVFEHGTTLVASWPSSEYVYINLSIHGKDLAESVDPEACVDHFNAVFKPKSIRALKLYF